ncbi:MAG TPA: TonB-dependent receptor [Gammaproteobacteria bacterium]
MRAAILAALAGYGAGAAQVAWAQDDEDQDEAAAATAGLEEIVVTATRRELSLQDVPLAVVAISAESMERQGIENMEDLNAVVPNVVIAGNNNGTDTAQFTMRGIPNVGVYVDGIWQVSNSGLLLREFVELERVEVLRGPQGTLYGRDSTGGAIRLYTKPPGEEFSGQVDVSLGNLERRDVKASVDLPFTENFRSRFTVGSYDRDGYITSQTTGFKTGRFEDEVVRADFIWEPSDRVTLRFNAQSDTIVSNTARVQTYIDPQIAYNSGFQVGLAEAFDIASDPDWDPVTGTDGPLPGRWNCYYACAGFPGGRLDEWESTSEITVPSRQWLEQQTVDLQVDLTDSISFQYLLGHTYVDARTYNDWDSGEFNFYIDYFNNETEVTSHEFQFTGGNDRFNWVGGVYLWDQSNRGRNPAWSMREWKDVPGYDEVQPFSYRDQVLTHPACQMTPAQRGITSWEPHVAAGYVPRFIGPADAPIDVLTLDVNSVDGWPFPCDATLGPHPYNVGTGWVGALAAGARPPSGDRLNGSETDGWAVFGEVTVGLTDRLDLTLGYRLHDQEQEQFEFDEQAGIAAGITAPKPTKTNQEWTAGGVYDGIRIPGSERRVSFDEDTVRASLSYAINNDAMVYVGYTEGFNSGGLAVYEDSLGTVQIQYDPELLKNKEIGLRSDWLDGLLRFNATYFFTDWIGIQLASTIPDRATGQEITELVPQNAASAEAKGWEFELSYAPTDRMLIQANIGLLDTRYTDSRSPVVKLDTEFSRAPDETYNLGFQYDFNTRNGGSLLWRIDASYTGAFWRSDTPTLRQNAYGVPRDYEAGDYWLLNSRLVFTPPDNRYELSLYGTNLTNEYIINSGFLHNIWQFDFATVDRPREVGVGMRIFF